MKIQIPVPCNENWENMKPGEKGRFCISCSKTVVDFTLMTTDEISAYLIQHRSQKICGRLTESQLAMEYDVDIYLAATHIARSEWCLMKKLAIIFVLFFALSQSGYAQAPQKAVQKASITAGTKPYDPIVLKKDSIRLSGPALIQKSDQCKEFFLGGLVIPEDKKATKRKLKQIKKQQQKQQKASARLTGEVVVVSGAIQTD